MHAITSKEDMQDGFHFSLLSNYPSVSHKFMYDFVNEVKMNDEVQLQLKGHNLKNKVNSNRGHKGQNSSVG